MRIQNNIMAINTHRQYGKAINSVSGSAEKLASGYRINRAGDDPAGLAISEKMRAQIRGLQMASKNSQDAVSLVQTAEGALQETHNILQRMRELAVQSASDTNEQNIDRQALEAEFSQLRNEIDDIANKTRFNDQTIINGSFQAKVSSYQEGDDYIFADYVEDISVERAKGGTYTMGVTLVEAEEVEATSGAAAEATIYSTSSTVNDIITGSGNEYAPSDTSLVGEIEFTGAKTSKHNGNVYTLKVNGSVLTDMSFQLLDSHGRQVAVTNGINVSEWSFSSGNTVNFEGIGGLTFNLNEGVEPTISGIQSLSEVKIHIDPEAGEEPIPASQTNAYLELEIDGETVRLSQGDTTANFTQSGIAFKFSAITDSDLDAAETKFGAEEIELMVKSTNQAPMIVQSGANMNDEVHINIDAMNAAYLGIRYSSIATQKSASKSIEEVNRALNTVSTQRSALGALQNRLDFKINNLDTSAENLQAAESRIRDVDMAKEMTDFTKKNILVQASTAMLAQANSAPQNVLSLLG